MAESKLIEFRESRGLTRYRVAKDLGVTNQSLARLEDPERPSDRAVVTTWHQGNHAVRSERWRYIRYTDGTEELYDHESDPDEYHNLASDPAYDPVKGDLARWLPDYDAPYQPPMSNEVEILRRLAERDGVLPGN